MELSRSRLLGVGIIMSIYNIVLIVLSTLGFEHNIRAAIIMFYLVVGLNLSVSTGFSIYHARMKHIESVIV